jgi:two-component system response regulator AdeR
VNLREVSAPQVLVVEDERELADLYADYLSDDYDTTVVYGGAAAIDAIHDGLDVVLLDRRMPDVSGEEVLSAIQGRSFTCRVAMVTALEPDFEVVDMPVDDYVVKPVGPEELVETVEQLVARATYDEQVREHVALVSKKAALEAAKPAGELAVSEEYALLEEEVAESRTRLETLLEDLEGTDKRAVMENLSRSANADLDLSDEE